MTELKEPGKLEVSFTNGALIQIKELADYFCIPQGELNALIIKGVQVLEEVKKSGNTYVIIEDLNGKREKVDLKTL